MTKTKQVPEVSVVIPIFNTLTYIERCVHSVLQQSFPNFELILVDDGSTDGSGALCEQLAASDERICVIHRPNGGRSRARNAGIKAARGVFVTFVDSDDRLAGDALQQLLLAIHHYKADMAVCRHCTVTPQGNMLQTVGLEREICLSGTEALRLILHDDKIKNYAWGKLFRRELLANSYFPEGRVYEDVATVYKWVARARSVVLTPYVGYEYLKNPQGIVMAKKGSHKWATGAVDNILAWTERYQFCKQYAQVSDCTNFCAAHTLLMILRFEERCLRYGIEPSIAQITTLVVCNNTLKADAQTHLMPKQAVDVVWAKLKLLVAMGMRRLLQARMAMLNRHELSV